MTTSYGTAPAEPFLGLFQAYYIRPPFDRSCFKLPCCDYLQLYAAFLPLPDVLSSLVRRAHVLTRARRWVIAPPHRSFIPSPPFSLQCFIFFRHRRRPGALSPAIYPL